MEDLQFYQELMDRVRQQPGVMAVGGVDILPLAPGREVGDYAYDEPSRLAWGQLQADYRTVLPGFFETLGARLIEGRFLDDRDNVGDGAVVVVDEGMAQRNWPAL